jgi:hypothetical protein
MSNPTSNHKVDAVLVPSNHEERQAAIASLRAQLEATGHEIVNVTEHASMTREMLVLIAYRPQPPESQE